MTKHLQNKISTLKFHFSDKKQKEKVGKNHPLIHLIQVINPDGALKPQGEKWTSALLYLNILPQQHIFVNSKFNIYLKSQPSRILKVIPVVAGSIHREYPLDFRSAFDKSHDIKRVVNTGAHCLSRNIKYIVLSSRPSYVKIIPAG